MLSGTGVSTTKATQRLSFLVACWLGILAPVALQAQVITFSGNWGAAGFNLTEQSSAGAEIVFSVTDLELQGQWVNGEFMQNVLLTGATLPNTAGSPNLPQVSRFIAIPRGAHVELELLEYRTEILPSVNVIPAYAIPRDQEVGDLRFELNPAVYNRDAYFPAQPVLLSESYSLRGVDVVILSVTPFQFNPLSRELLVYKDLRIRLSFLGGNAQFGEERLRSRWWDPILRQNLLNFEMLPTVNYNRTRNLDSHDNVNYEYLIVTLDNPSFTAWADTLKKWRSEQGIMTGVVTLSQIGGNDPLLIENYINNAYNTWEIPPVAVLLLGDYQPSGNPNGIVSPTCGGTLISDNVYADVDGDTLPDLNIARIPAQNAAQLQTMIGKMLSYERYPYTNNQFYQNPVFTGGWQTETWYILCNEVVAGFFQNQLGKVPKRVYAIYSGAPGSVWSTSPNTTTVVNHFGPDGTGYIPATPTYLTNWGGDAARINGDLNRGAFLIQHRDHGGVMGWTSPSYLISDLSALSNNMFPYVVSVNCLTGKFSNPDPCFAEVLMTMQCGALGVLAATDVSYSFVNDTYVWGCYDYMWPNFDPEYGSGIGASIYPYPGFANAAGKYYLQASSWPTNPQIKAMSYQLFHHFGDAFMTLYTALPQQLSVIHSLRLVAGANAYVVSANSGALISLSVNGEVIGTGVGTGAATLIPIQPVASGNVVKIVVTKPNYYRYSANVQVSAPNGAYITYNSGKIRDAQTGNGNGQWDLNERIKLDIMLKNIGFQPATQINASLSTTDPLVNIVDGTEYFGSIAAGDSVGVQGAFMVENSGAVEDLHEVTFALTATSGNQSWLSCFSVLINAPELSFSQLVINDATGNNNQILDPGETVQFLLTMTNTGHATAENVRAALTSTNPQVTISGDWCAYGSVAPGSSITQAFTVTASSSISSGITVLFNYLISGSAGYSNNSGFSIVVGDERNLPCGPDAYGYYAWDHQDGNPGEEFNWIEIAPAVGGNGTILDLPNDDQTITVTLPFSFRFYGLNSSQVSICTNGWLSIAATSNTAYVNTPIPNTYGPPSMIAAFWDNLHPGYGGSQICTLSDTLNHRFIIEWYNVAHYNLSPMRETFEVILLDPVYYPTPNGDGIIIVQYLQVTDVSSASFGIENRTQDVGLQVAYNGAYNPHAWQIEAGSAITYSTSPAGGIDNGKSWWMSAADGNPAGETQICANYPNPFNSTTAVSYQLAAFSYVHLKIYDTAGRLVATLVDGWREAGSHEVTFGDSDLPSGIYICRLEAGDFKATQKLVLLK